VTDFVIGVKSRVWFFHNLLDISVLVKCLVTVLHWVIWTIQYAVDSGLLY